MRPDSIDKQILASLVEDGRRTYDDIGRQVSLSGPAVKRRIDRLRAGGVLRGFTAVLDHAALEWHTEALLELYQARGVHPDELIGALQRYPNVVEAWRVTGPSDLVVRVRVEGPHVLEAMIGELHSSGLIENSRAAVVLRHVPFGVDGTVSGT